MRKRLLAMLIALVMVASLLPVAALAAGNTVQSSNGYVSVSYKNDGALERSITVNIYGSDGTLVDTAEIYDAKYVVQRITITLNSNYASQFDIESVDVSGGSDTSMSISADTCSFNLAAIDGDDGATVSVYLCEEYVVPALPDGLIENSDFTRSYRIYDDQILKLLHDAGVSVSETTEIKSVQPAWVKSFAEDYRGFDRIDREEDYWHLTVTSSNANVETVQPNNIRKITITYDNGNGEQSVNVYSGDLRYRIDSESSSRYYRIELNDDSFHIVYFYNEPGSQAGNNYFLYAVRFVEHGTSLGTDMPPQPDYGTGNTYMFVNWEQGSYDGTGDPFLSTTVVNEDLTVFAKKVSSPDDGGTEIWVMNYEDDQLLKRVAELYNETYSPSIDVADIDLDSVKISVYDNSKRTNKDYYSNGWRNDEEYYYVCNYNVPAGLPTLTNNHVAFNDIQGITVFFSLVNSGIAQFVQIPVGENPGDIAKSHSAVDNIIELRIIQPSGGPGGDDDKVTYTVNYYYDGVLDADNTETLTGNVGDEIESVPDKSGTGYCLDRDDLPFTLTADESANVIGVYYATDANGDDIPDKYQVTVTYDVVNGSWAEGGSGRKQQTLTLMTAGAWDENGTAEAEFPGVAAYAGYKAGAWEPADTTVTRESDHSFVYTFVKDESQTKPFSYEVRYVGDDGAELGSEQLQADIWVGDASYTVENVEIKDFEGYEYERTEPALPAELSEGTAGVITVYYKASTQPVEPEEAQPWIRVYMDEATAADFKGLGGQQVRLYSEKYPGGYRACAPLSGYWWTENNVYKLVGSDIEKIVFAKDNPIGPSDKIEIPAEGNETYKVEFSIVDSGLIHYLKIYISKVPAAVYGVSYEFMSGTEGMSLPEAGMPELPVDDAEYEVGAVVRNKGGDSYGDVAAAGGRWSFTGWDAQEKAMVEGGVSFTGTWVYAPDPETAPVYAVIYRNGNTETPFRTVKLGDAPLGSDYSLSGLDIDELYSSAYGFEFEGWYNDGGWNRYKAGDPGGTLAGSIRINGWTNLICMVTDYEKVVVKAVTDGDKDGAETVFDGKALHGLNTIQFLEGAFTPEERAGYELDKWYNWDWYGHKYAGTARINGWTNAYVTYTSIIPEKPGGDDVKALLGDAVIVDCVNAAAQHGSMKFGLIDGSFEVGPVEGSTLAGGITCSVSVSANAYVAAYNDSLPGTKHELVSPGTARVTLEWTGTEWKAADGSAPLTFQVRCELTPEPPAPGKPGFDDIKGLFEGKIYVDCVTNARHDTLRFGLMQDHFRVTEPALAADGNYTCTVILFANAYQAEYNTRTGTKHYLAEYETNASVELKWNVQAGAWLVTGGELPVVFDVVCEPDLPPYIPPVAPSEPVYRPNWLNTTDHFGYIIGYEDGTIKPDASITRAEVATIFFRLLTDEARDKFWTETNSYSDVAETAWYNNAVSTLSRMGILGGYEDGTFRPNASITRAEFAKIAVSFFEYEDISAENIFTDVAAGSWYENFVAVAAKLGLIEGYAGNVYRPNESITRAEACTIINRTLGRAPDADHLLPESEMNTWPDNRPGVWYYAQLQEATNSHEYKWSGDIEHWTAKLPERDWDALQR